MAEAICSECGGEVDDPQLCCGLPFCDGCYEMHAEGTHAEA